MEEAQGMAMTADGYSTYMYDLIKKVMDDIGPRESCSEQERELGRLFGSEIAPVCEKVVTDDFTCSPTAFLGFFPYLVRWRWLSWVAASCSSRSCGTKNY
jgi:hypothetical protein